jgi:hypothetical protein
MTLDDNQKQQVAAWVEDGVKLAEIQNRLATEMGINLTYMEIRFLVDDLDLVPKEPDPPAPEEPTPSTGDSPLEVPASSASTPQGEMEEGDRLRNAGSGGVSVTVDSLTKPGSLVSGNVTFSDGNTAEWYLDQMGRLGLAPKTEGYRPSPADVQEFQTALEKEIQRAGL